MTKFETHKLPNGFRGDAIQVASAGNGVPCADPKLTVLWKDGGIGAEFDIVSGTSVAVGINEDGYLEPASEKLKAIGFVATPLLGTKKMLAEVTGKYNGLGHATGGHLNYADSMIQLTPTVYQRNVLLQMGLAYKTAGATADLFKIKVGDSLRVITSTEIETAISDETLPVLFDDEKKDSGEHAKTAAMYAGRLVKWDPEKDKADAIVGRVLGMRAPAQYDNYVYAGDFAYGMDIQGPATRGLSRDVFNYIGTVLDSTEHTKTIVDFCPAI